jgi:4-diphosphocytidyl-2-C-methyl-D-erythritol kinase
VTAADTPANSGLLEFAPAKVNLTLRVLGRRGDGYHELESLVVFSENLADRLSLTPGGPLGLEVSGPTAAAAGADTENLVLKAARALAARVENLTLGRFILHKHLPVAAGIGGGSSDAAAALRLLARANQIAMDDERLFDAARATGADVPVCLDRLPRVMSGIGDRLGPPLRVPRLPAVLINPGVAVPTRDVFARLELEPAAAEMGSPPEIPSSRATMVSWLALGRNDLERPAIAIAPAIAEALDVLRAHPDCRLVRMSGSGATCFGLFETSNVARAAAHALGKAHPSWWISASYLGGVRPTG